MRKVIGKVTLPEGQRKTTLLEIGKSDLTMAKKAYKSWKELSKTCRALNSRRVNMPEAVSEVVVCYEMGFLKKDSTKKSNKFVASWDAYNPENNKRVQIKSCSVANDLSSFGPRSKFDEFYFVDFHNNGKQDGTYRIYQIPETIFKKIKVNKKTTLGQMQKLGKRPRFSIKQAIIKKYNLKPIKVGKIV